MTKQEIIDYIMTTPSNPNKAVLEGMLDSFSEGEGGGGGGEQTGDVVFKMASSSFELQAPTTIPAYSSSVEEAVVHIDMNGIGSGAFNACTNLKKAVFEGSMQGISGGAFAGCTGLEYVYIKNAQEINSAAFVNCTQSNLVIDCGFAEGTVSGAPWGATNATINYNVPAPKEV